MTRARGLALAGVAAVALGVLALVALDRARSLRASTVEIAVAGCPTRDANAEARACEALALQLGFVIVRGRWLPAGKRQPPCLTPADQPAALAAAEAILASAPPLWSFAWSCDDLRRRPIPAGQLLQESFLERAAELPASERASRSTLLRAALWLNADPLATPDMRGIDQALHAIEGATSLGLASGIPAPDLVDRELGGALWGAWHRAVLAEEWCTVAGCPGRWHELLHEMRDIEEHVHASRADVRRRAWRDVMSAPGRWKSDAHRRLDGHCCARCVAEHVTALGASTPSSCWMLGCCGDDASTVERILAIERSARGGRT